MYPARRRPACCVAPSRVVLAVAIALGGCADAVTAPAAPCVPLSDGGAAASRSAHYAAPAGSACAAGDAESPWDLTTALSGAGGRVTPGDTVWLRAGTYRGAWTSTLAGTPAAPIVVRPEPGARAILDHRGSALTTLSVRGEWSVFRDLEVMNSAPSRVSSSEGSEQRPNGIVNSASHTRFINLSVHDAGVGFYNYSHAFDVEVYGSLFYNNGWQGPDRGHGHGLYVKSSLGPVTLRENIIFNQFGWGVHAYTERGTGALHDVRLERNVVFNNGTQSLTPGAQNILLGGREPVSAGRVVGNVAWHAPSTAVANVRLGYDTLTNSDVVVSDNHFVGGQPVLRIDRWNAASLSGNLLAGPNAIVALLEQPLGGFSWTASQQLQNPLATAWSYGALETSFALWSATTGLATTDIVDNLLPPASTVITLPNAHEPGRATIAVINWQRAPSIAVVLDAVLSHGTAFEIVDAQTPMAAPVLQGTYGGSVNLPMHAVAPVAPVGMSVSRAPLTGPEFKVFIVRRREPPSARR